jgi:hypothetical protein
MTMNRKTASLCLAALAMASTAAVSAQAQTWEPFVIRTVAGATTPVVPVGTSNGTSFTVNIDEAGEKAGYGTSFFDGGALSNVQSVSYTRVDPGTKDPYVNIWIRDNAGHSAVIAPVTNLASTGGYTSNNVDGLNLQALGFNIYETDFNDLGWLGIAGAHRVAQALIQGGDALGNGGTVVTLADIGGLTVDDPGSPYSGFVGTGAPKNDTGFNLIFGDTQGNFTSPVPYSIANVSAVPEPGTFALIGLGAAAMLLRRGRRNRTA